MRNELSRDTQHLVNPYDLPDGPDSPAIGEEQAKEQIGRSASRIVAIDQQTQTNAHNTVRTSVLAQHRADATRNLVDSLGKLGRNELNQTILAITGKTPDQLRAEKESRLRQRQEGLTTIVNLAAGLLTKKMGEVPMQKTNPIPSKIAA